MDIKLTTLKTMLEAPLSPSDGEKIAEQLHANMDHDALSQGVHRTEATTVLWAVEVEVEAEAQGGASPELVTRTYADGAMWHEWEAPQPSPRPDVLATGVQRHAMQRLAGTNLYVVVKEMSNFTATAYRVEIGERKCKTSWVVVEYFEPEPDCLPQPDVLKGTVTEHTWKSDIFAGTVREYWVYVPEQYRPEEPACLMVFQDGGMYLKAPADVPTVFDNLIHKGELPVTVGLFVNCGTFPEQPKRFQNRSFEYDTLSDQYARMLRDELIPEVARTVNLRTDAAWHAICGISSGGICAMNVAWQMPDLFGKVLSHVGSFTNIRGGHNLWTLVRQEERKPIRVYLQDGANDIDNARGNWPLANMEMAAALKFRGYDYRFDYGRGFHSLAHGGATLPSSLRWLWRE
jgi:enterochelin esterase family protein